MSGGDAIKADGREVIFNVATLDVPGTPDSVAFANPGTKHDAFVVGREIETGVRSVVIKLGAVIDPVAHLILHPSPFALSAVAVLMEIIIAHIAIVVNMENRAHRNFYRDRAAGSLRRARDGGDLSRDSTRRMRATYSVSPK